LVPQQDVIGAAAVALARSCIWPYLEHEAGKRRQRRIFVSVRSGGRPKDRSMAQPSATQPETRSVLRPARGVVPAIMVGGAGLGVAILFGALVLWFHYGTTVFFETIVSGIASCF
jgi:hypothetical protein